MGESQKYKFINKINFLYLPSVKVYKVLVGPSIQTLGTNISNWRSMVKNPNWRQADQLAFYKCGRVVELVSTWTGSI